MSIKDETNELLVAAKKRLNYNHNTGLFTWVNPKGYKVKPGDVAGSIRPDGYVSISVRTIPILAHRLAWAFYYNSWPTDEIDHINCNRRDNRICNLRNSDRSRNCMNRNQRNDNTSGHKGVSFDKKSGKWVARCQARGVRYVVGYYEDKDVAACTLKKFRADLHLEFKNNGEKE